MKRKESSTNKWQIYEQEKSKLQSKCLTASEYDEEIRKIVKRLKV